MIENPYPVTVLTEPTGLTISRADLRARIEDANRENRAFAYLFSDSTADPVQFLSGMGTLESYLRPTDPDSASVATKREEELAFLKTLLGSNARYLSMPLVVIEGELLHNEVDIANQITKSPYSISLKLGTNIGGYYHLVAAPVTSSFGNAKQINIIHHIANK